MPGLPRALQCAQDAFRRSANRFRVSERNAAQLVAALLALTLLLVHGDGLAEPAATPWKHEGLEAVHFDGVWLRPRPGVSASLDEAGAYRVDNRVVLGAPGELQAVPVADGCAQERATRPNDNAPQSSACREPLNEREQLGQAHAILFLIGVPIGCLLTMMAMLIWMWLCDALRGIR